jgi:hypothetical protein
MFNILKQTIILPKMQHNLILTKDFSYNAVNLHPYILETEDGTKVEEKKASRGKNSQLKKDKNKDDRDDEDSNNGGEGLRVL